MVDYESTVEDVRDSERIFEHPNGNPLGSKGGWASLRLLSSVASLLSRVFLVPLSRWIHDEVEERRRMAGRSSNIPLANRLSSGPFLPLFGRRFPIYKPLASL